MPGKPSDPIICSLSTASLDGNPQYDALSYVWGDPTICDKIIVDQQERNVTANLYAALRRLRNLRDATEPKELWVDALCINQDDKDEKTHQVGLMGRIYSRAREVFIWLGDCADDPFTFSDGKLTFNNCPSVAKGLPGTVASQSDVILGFLFIQLLANHGPGTSGCVQNPQQDDGDGDPSPATMGLRAYEKGLRAIMDFSWWSRLWTVQEVVLSQKATVVCGSVRLPWQSFAVAAINLRINFRYCKYRCCSGLDFGLRMRFTETVKSIFDIADAVKSPLPIEPMSRVEVFTRFRDRVASDPRDRVYAMLGILGNPEIKPDYSLDHRIVYANAVVAIIQKTKLLDILWRPREFDRDPMLPSWTPDWTARVETGKFAMEINQFRHLLLESAVGHPCVTVGYTPEHGALTLMGVQVDTVVSTFDAMEHKHLSTRATDSIIRSWLNAIDKSKPYRRGGKGEGTYEEAFWTLMAGDHIVIGSGEDEILPVDLKNDVVFAKRGTTLYVATMATYRRMEPEEWRLIRDDYEGRVPLLEENLVPQCLINQRFFLTESGLIGLGPVDTRVGDTIHVLLGGKFPFLLRKVAETGTFNLVGASFVQGIMYGEAVPDGTLIRRVTLV
ncbi:hypothetical protein OQA88_11947 [Cercophora sp. LCS_1]